MSEAIPTSEPGPAAPQLTNDPVPAGIAITLSGGGFRAACFHLGVLRALRFSTVAPLRDVSVLVGVSGGALVAAHVRLAWLDCLGDFDAVARRLLPPIRQGMHRQIMFLWPWLSALHLVWQAFAFVLSFGSYWRPVWIALRSPLRRFGSIRTTLLARRMDDLFRNATLDSAPGTGPATALLTSNANGRISACTDVGWAARIEPDESGAVVGVEEASIRAGYAVAASACFPAFFPMMRVDERTLNLGGNAEIKLSDGGVLDNSGTSAIRSPGWSRRPTPAKVLVADASLPLDGLGGSEGFGYIRTMTRTSDILMARSARLEEDVTRGALSSVTAIRIGSAFKNGALHHDHQVPLRWIRTDFDSFSETEIDALVTHGYHVTRRALGESVDQWTAGHAWPELSRSKIRELSESPPKSAKSANRMRHRIADGLRAGRRRRVFSNGLRGWKIDPLGSAIIALHAVLFCAVMIFSVIRIKSVIEEYRREPTTAEGAFSLFVRVDHDAEAASFVPDTADPDMREKVETLITNGFGPELLTVSDYLALGALPPENDEFKADLEIQRWTPDAQRLTEALKRLEELSKLPMEPGGTLPLSPDDLNYWKSLRWGPVPAMNKSDELKRDGLVRSVSFMSGVLRSIRHLYVMRTLCGRNKVFTLGIGWPSKAQRDALERRLRSRDSIESRGMLYLFSKGDDGARTGILEFADRASSLDFRGEPVRRRRLGVIQWTEVAPRSLYRLEVRGSGDDKFEANLVVPVDGTERRSEPIGGAATKGERISVRVTGVKWRNLE